MKWYAEDVERAIAERNNCPYKPKTVFYGSSSIRLWDNIYEDFKDLAPVNLGFGGSTLAACIWFFNDIVAPVVNPMRILLYAGDNDLGDGRRPEEVCIFFQLFIVKLREHFKKTPCYFISIKPSPSRLKLLPEIISTNKLIKNYIEKNNGHEYFIDVYDKMVDHNGKPLKKYFDDDGLHMSRKGYELWKEIILDKCLQ